MNIVLGQESRTAEYGHSLAICESGSIVGFGFNQECQIGTGSDNPASYEYPYQVNDITNAVAVAVGQNHSLALLDNGAVMAWGRNTEGEVGQSSTADFCDPIEVDLPGCAVAISAGNAFSLALLADGTVWAWGYNEYGQLGNGDEGNSTHVPDQVLGSISNAIAISAGSSHAMALLDDGTVKVWGYGIYGQMGDGTNGSGAESNDVPVTASASGFSDIVQIDAGDQHCVARKDNGDIYVWGYNYYGQLGQGNTTSSDIPIKSTGLSSSTSVDIAAGVNFTIVLKSNGDTKATGFNANRELGNCSNPLDYYTTPISGPALSGCLDICTPSTASLTLAVMSNGDLKGWGDDSKDQLGVVTSDPHFSCSPVLINDPYIVWEEPAGFYCPVKPSADNFPQPCCVAIREDERILIGEAGDETLTTGFNYNGDYLAIDHTITLSSGAYYLTNSDVVFLNDAKIIVEAGVWLIINNSHLYACDEMWEGIEAKNGSYVYVYNGSIVEDAKTALDIEYGSYYYIISAIFNKNHIHVNKRMPSSGSPIFPGNYVISKSKFLCQVSEVDDTHTTLRAPYLNQITFMGIKATGVPRILVGNTSSANFNTFDNGSWGIYADDVDKVHSYYNKFTDIGLIGVHVLNGNSTSGNHTIEINHNEIEGTPYGIICYDNDTTVRAHITYNEIDFTGMTPQVMTGITVEEITPASEHNTANFFDISNNTIHSAPCGIKAVNLQGDLFTTDAALYIGENYITHTKIPNDDQSGIKTENVTQGAFVSNEVLHPDSSVNWWESGMRISNGSANALLCNYTHHIGRGVIFDSWQNGTDFINNTMEANQIGLFLNWAVIGAQGSSGNPHDNKWLGTSWNSSDPNTHVEGTDGGDSPFFVRSSSPYNPQYNGNGGGGDPLDIFTTSGSWGGGCVYTSGASFKTDGTATEGAEELLRLIALDEPETERERSQQYMGHYNLYDMLLEDAELTSTNSELETFVAERNADNMGKLHQVVVNFRSARSATVETEDANMLNAVQPQNMVEQTLKDVFYILYTHAADLTTIDAYSEVRLREIAQLCPLDYGFGVYTARAALIKLDTLPKNYLSECERVPSPEQMSKKRELEDSNVLFSLYPNPNNGTFNLNYVLNEGETGTVEVFSAIGQQIYSAVLQSGSQSQGIELKETSNGIYQVRVTVNGDVRLSSKLVILN